MRNKQIRLNKAQNLKLFQWVSANHQDFHGKADKEVARMAFGALGFDVSTTTITDIRTDPDIEVTWRTSKDKEPETRITSDADIHVLADTLLKIIGKLNSIQIYMDIDPAFGELLDRLDVPHFKAANSSAPLPHIQQHSLGV